MENDNVNYFVCTYGFFDERRKVIDESLESGEYRLNIEARFPSAMSKIKQGDLILLKDGALIIACGIVSAKAYFNDVNRKNGWCRIVEVEEWIKLKSSINAYGIKENTIIGSSTAVVRQVKKEWVNKKNIKIEEVIKNKIEENKNKISLIPNNTEQKVICTNIEFKDLIKENLNIPNYQRAYCWRKENILGLLESLKSWAVKYANDNILCHCGTIIFKNKGNKFDIIDGQQRLLTLAIFQYCLDEKEAPELLNQNLCGNENLSEVAKGFLIRAKNTINEWILQNKEISRQILKIIEFCVVVLPKNASEDLAYFFFNTTNSTGKRLSDYDLLKNHHLRYVPNESAGFVANRWNRFENSELSELLHKSLYRLRHWNHRESFNLKADRSPNNLLFKHFSVKDEPFPNFYEIPLTSNFDSKVNGGMEFFSFVETYRSKFKIFEDFACVKDLKDNLSWHSNGVLHDAIKAISFLFYCKFGEQYLKEAIFCIAFRLSKVRNEKKRLQQTVLYTENIFAKCVKELDQNTSLASFFAWALDINYRYAINFSSSTETQKIYWKSLKTLFEQLSKNGDFALMKQKEEILKQIREQNENK